MEVLKVLTRQITITPNSYDEETRSFEVIFSMGGAVKRALQRDGEKIIYNEVLSLEPDHVDMARLHKGAPFLDNHKKDSVHDVLGVVRSARVEKGVGYAVIQLSKRSDLDDLARDIKDGIVRGISVGYTVDAYRDISDVDEDGEVTEVRLLATQWQPTEVSLSPVQAEAVAQVRELEQKYITPLYERAIMSAKKKITDTPVIEPAPDVKNTAIDEQKIRKQVEQEALTRAADIMQACTSAGMDNEFTRELVGKNLSLEASKGLILDEMVRNGKSKQISSDPAAVVEIVGKDTTVKQRELIENAILNRYEPEKYKLKEGAAKYRQMNLVNITRSVMESTLTGDKAWSMDKDDIVERALTGSDAFPEILNNIANITLRQGYEQQAQTFLPLVTWGELPDFKEASRVMIGTAPALEPVLENGEYRYGTIDETGERIQLATYGKITSITRKTIINDRLNALAGIPAEFGKQTANLESDLFWGQVIANAAMRDGFNVFSSEHSNLAASGSAISVASVSAGRLAMQNQKHLDGKTFIHIPVSYMVVPVSLQTHAEQFLAKSDRNVDSATQDYNPFGKGGTNPLGLIAEPRLDVSSVLSWFLFSNAVAAAMIEMATLDGVRGPKIYTRQGFDVDGIQIKASYDVSCKILDSKGMYKNPGA